MCADLISLAYIYVLYKLKNGNAFLCVLIVIILLIPNYIFLYMRPLNFSSISVDCTNIIPLYTFILTKVLNKFQCTIVKFIFFLKLFQKNIELFSIDRFASSFGLICTLFYSFFPVLLPTQLQLFQLLRQQKQ